MIRRLSIIALAVGVISVAAFGFSISGHVTGLVGPLPPPYVFAIPMTFDTVYFTLANPFGSYSYNISGPVAGSYIMFSWRDIIINLRPDLSEPRGFYGGFPPQLLVLSSDTADIDIELLPPNSGGFYGATTYNGSHTGITLIVPHRAADMSDLPRGIGVLLDSLNINDTGNGNYTAFADSFGIYYVEAYMDLNSNFIHDADEPYGVYGGNTPQPIDIQPSSFPDNVDITLEDPSGTPSRPEFLPVASGLGEIYPNPFNASTTITFNLTDPSQIELLLIDVLGRQVDMIMAGMFNAGSHQIIYQAGDRPSGLYFVCLKTGNQSFIRRLLLLK